MDTDTRDKDLTTQDKPKAEWEKPELAAASINDATLGGNIQTSDTTGENAGS